MMHECQDRVSRRAWLAAGCELGHGGVDSDACPVYVLREEDIADL